jgi:hypothetical protein
MEIVALPLGVFLGAVVSALSGFAFARWRAPSCCMPSIR